MSEYAVVRTDNLSGTTDGSKLVSLRYFVGATETDIENGMVVKIEGYVVGEREVFKAVKPAKDTPLNEIALVASPELMYDERKKNLNQFINKAGEVASRGYTFESGDTFSVTEEALTGTTIKVGDLVELQADTKLKVVATATAESTQVGKIVAIERVGIYTYYVIRVA